MGWCVIEVGALIVGRRYLISVAILSIGVAKEFVAVSVTVCGVASELQIYASCCVLVEG